jgi:rhomboid protease GluP
MPNCLKCGAKLPSFTFGEASPYCKTCRSEIPSEPRPGTIDVIPEAVAASTSTPATYGLVAVNVAVFVAMIAFGVSWFDPKTEQVLRWGADYGPKTLDGQYWRLITSMFLHFGIIHILANMWCLWSLGRLSEKLLGSFTTAGLYLLTGVGASLLSLSWDPMRVSAGASGAIFGIAGALITVLYYGQLNLTKESVRSLLGYVIRFCLLNLVFGLRAHVDNMGHLGGMVTGLLMGLFLARTLNPPVEDRPARRRTVFAISALVLLALFIPVARAKAYAVEFSKGQEAFDHEDYNAAIAHLQKYSAAQPDNALGHALLGGAFQGAGRFEDAVREYERGLAINPDFLYIQVHLAELYVLEKKPDKAVPLFRKAIPEMKDDAYAMYSYGDALKQTGDLGGAEDALRKSILLDDKQTYAHTLLAEVLKAEGKTAEARTENARADDLGQAKDAHDDPAPKKH